MVVRLWRRALLLGLFEVGGLVGCVRPCILRFFSAPFRLASPLSCCSKSRKIEKRSKNKRKKQEHAVFGWSFGGSDVSYYRNIPHFSCVPFYFYLYFLLFRGFQARWLAYTCHHRTWQSVGSERFCYDLSLKDPIGSRQYFADSRAADQVPMKLRPSEWGCQFSREVCGPDEIDGHGSS